MEEPILAVLAESEAGTEPEALYQPPRHQPKHFLQLAEEVLGSQRPEA